MKTAIVCSGWNGGGTERYVQYLGEVHRAAGWEPILVLEQKMSSRANCPDCFSDMIELMGKAREDESLVDRLRACSVRVAHLNIWGDVEPYRQLETTDAFAAMQTYHATLPSIEWWLFGRLWRPGQLLRRVRFLRRKLLPALPTVCISKWNEEKFRTIYPTIPTAQIYYGVRSIDRVKRRSHTKQILWVGSFSPRKNPILAIDAFAQFYRNYPNAAMTMCGKGELFAKCAKRARRNDLPISLPGHVEDISEYIANADVLLISSKDEGIPYAAAEAMSASVPIVTTNCGAIAEAVSGDCGEIVPATTCALSKGLKRILLSDVANSYGVAARRRYEELFSFDRFAMKTLEFTERIMHDHQRPR